jgi:hypothetical protein
VYRSAVSKKKGGSVRIESKRVVGGCCSDEGDLQGGGVLPLGSLLCRELDVEEARNTIFFAYDASA